MVIENRTPLIVASTYMSANVMKLILSLFEANVNCPCGLDKSTALRCAASGGSVNVVDVVKLLLEAGVDLNAVDAGTLRQVLSCRYKGKQMVLNTGLDLGLQVERQAGTTRYYSNWF